MKKEYTDKEKILFYEKQIKICIGSLTVAGNEGNIFEIIFHAEKLSFLTRRLKFLLRNAKA